MNEVTRRGSGNSAWRVRMRLLARRLFASTPRVRPVLGTRGMLFEDIAETWRQRELCFSLAYQRSTSRLRRTLLGPLWIVLSFVLTTLGLALFWAEIIDRPFEAYFPFITMGFYVWNFVIGALTDGARALQDNRSLALQTRTPVVMYPVMAVLKQSVVALYNLPYLLVVMLLYAPTPDWTLLYVIPGAVLVFMTTLAGAVMLAVWCAYLPDLIELIAASLRFLFFLTPVIWMPLQRTYLEAFWMLNPFYHLLHIVRGPVLQADGVLFSMTVCAVTAVGAWITAAATYHIGAGAVSTRL